MNDEQEKVQARIHSLGQQIRAHRIAQNLSQQRLALMVHTDQAVIARIEAGKHNTGIAKYIEIADALDVPLGALINFYGEELPLAPHQSSERASERLVQALKHLSRVFLKER